MTEPLRDVLRDVLHPWCKGTVDEVIAALAQQGVTLTREPGLDAERTKRLVAELIGIEASVAEVTKRLHRVLAALASEDRP